MARSTNPSFVTEIPLKVNNHQERELLARFQAARQLYNVCLGEAMIRMEQTKKSQPYQEAKRLRGKDKKKSKDLYSEARKQCRYSDYDLQSFATLAANKSKWIADKLDAHTKQTIGKRAFKASERVMFGKAKKVRNKVASRFKSVEGKSNKQSLRFVNNQVVWKKLTLEPVIDWTNLVVVHGLNSKIKYCRLLWRFIGQKRKWYVQLICEGLPYQKPQNYIGDGVIGLDLNLNNVAFVANNKAGLLPFAEKVPTFDREITQLQRKLSRSSRINNPNNFEPDFEARKGNKIVLKKGKAKKSTSTKKIEWINTKTYTKNQRKLANLKRKRSVYAKSQNRRLVNEILRHGNIIKTENVSVKGWQRRYGKAISLKCPGFFQSELHRKAEKAGGQFIKFSTRKTALSQTHSSGKRIKKKLSERVHHDVNGFTMHRDLWSAYLARHVYGDSLSVLDAILDYPWSEPIMLDAWKEYQSASRLGKSESRKPILPLEQMSGKVLPPNQIVIKDEKLG